MDCEENVDDYNKVKTDALDSVENTEESISDRLSLAILPEAGGKMKTKKR